MPTRQSAIRLFRVKGIDVFLHWSWFLVAYYEVQHGVGNYTSPIWRVAEYLGLFAMVTLHEFGHALACRQVGGTANQIVLWPLGGVAYVQPPPRPGASLWSTAAGPLVNVALIPLLLLVGVAGRAVGWQQTLPNFRAMVQALARINLILLVFNILPIYPLDGGKILRSLLWFVMGRARSLMVATVLGFLGIAALVLLALYLQSFWIGIVAVFMVSNCWSGLKQARALANYEKMPRHQAYACPSCHDAPPVGELWVCTQCKQQFDTFQSQGKCPRCSAEFPTTQCITCGQDRPFKDWTPAPMITAGV
jgi:Zn-dependent protease